MADANTPARHTEIRCLHLVLLFFFD